MCVCDVMCECSAYNVYHMRTWCLWRSEEVTGSSEIGITESCESPCGAGKLNLGLLKAQQKLLTAEPFLQVHVPISRLGSLKQYDSCSRNPRLPVFGESALRSTNPHIIKNKS